MEESLKWFFFSHLNSFMGRHLLFFINEIEYIFSMKGLKFSVINLDSSFCVLGCYTYSGEILVNWTEINGPSWHKLDKRISSQFKWLSIFTYFMLGVKLNDYEVPEKNVAPLCIFILRKTFNRQHRTI